MTRQDFFEKMKQLFPEADEAQATIWADYLEKNQAPFESVHGAFYGVHQQYGGELANLMFITGPRRYCLYPNEFMLAAEYLYGGGAIEQIDERPSHEEKQDCSLCQTMSMTPGGR